MRSHATGAKIQVSDGTVRCTRCTETICEVGAKGLLNVAGSHRCKRAAAEEPVEKAGSSQKSSKRPDIRGSLMKIPWQGSRRTAYTHTHFHQCGLLTA